MAAPEAEREIDRLYAVPVAEFVGERKKLADALKAAGHVDQAKAVAKLARPTVPAWVVNQLARREHDAIEQLAEVTATLKSVQAGAGAGGDALATAAADHRRILAELHARAEDILNDAKHAPSPQVLRRVMTNLRAGLADDETRPLVEAGRLSQDIEERGFTDVLGFGGGAPAASGNLARTSSARPAEKRPVLRVVGPAEKPERSDKAETARDAISRRREEAAAEREREQAERARARARELAEQRAGELRAARTAARHAVEEGERAVAAARQAVSTSEARAEIARTKLEKVTRQLASAEDDLARLRST